MTLGFWLNNLPVERTGMTLGEWIASWFRPRPAKPAPTPAPAPVPEASLLDCLNSIRQQYQLTPFLPHGKADMIAISRAERNRARGWEGHDGFQHDIEDHFPRQATAECIAAGQKVAREVVEDWMNEKPKQGRRPHREAILGPYRYVGCGRSGDYWCAIFLGPE